MPRAHDYEELESLALPIIQQEPGITANRLTRRLGLPLYYTTSGLYRPNQAVQKLCKILIEKGAIEVRKVGSQSRQTEAGIYPAGYESRRKYKLFEPVKGHQPVSVRVINPSDPDYSVPSRPPIPAQYRPKWAGGR